ncbi:MAG: hypothetical protein ACRDFX_06040 [Chloroflexota bacterium]
MLRIEWTLAADSRVSVNVGHNLAVHLPATAPEFGIAFTSKEDGATVETMRIEIIVVHGVDTRASSVPLHPQQKGAAFNAYTAGPAPVKLEEEGSPKARVNC